ncbi:MAG: hypothetical protein WB438_03655 [Candidatus Cybelea sp.]
MPRACSICGHADTAQMAKAIAAGGANRDIARRFSVNPSAVQRHRVNCLRSPRRPEKSGAERERTNLGDSIRFASDATDPKALIRRAELLLDDATAICARAKSDGNARLALQALRECRSSLELLMRAHGMLQPDGATTIDNRTQILSFKELTTDELRSLAQLAEGQRQCG